jgi:hypothetical protein
MMIFFSYDSGLPGGVTSEWVDDKLKAIFSLTIPVVLITGPRSSLVDSEKLTVVRRHSLSWKDYKSEVGFSSNRLTSMVRKTMAASFGRAFDWSFQKLAGSHSHGKWSWVFSAFPVALY